MEKNRMKRRIFKLIVAAIAFGFCAAVFAAEDKAPAKAFDRNNIEQVRKRADKGDPMCQGLLAEFYRRGSHGLKKDYAKSEKWASDSALQKHPYGFYNLAVLFENGYGVDMDINSAQSLYLQAFPGLLKLARDGDSVAQYKIAYMYLYGKGAREDTQEGLLWLNKAAEKGNPSAEYLFGYLHFNGIKTSKSFPVAMRWLEKAAEHGNARSETLLGLAFLNGYGVEKNIGKAFEYFKEAAKKGEPAAQYMLGVMYYEGCGTEKNLSEAINWIRQSAESGEPKAQHMMGRFCEDGEGMPKDYKKAVEWYSKAASSGDKTAFEKLRKR